MYVLHLLLQYGFCWTMLQILYALLNRADHTSKLSWHMKKKYIRNSIFLPSRKNLLVCCPELWQQCCSIWQQVSSHAVLHALLYKVWCWLNLLYHVLYLCPYLFHASTWQMRLCCLYGISIRVNFFCNFFWKFTCKEIFFLFSPSGLCK